MQHSIDFFQPVAAARRHKFAAHIDHTGQKKLGSQVNEPRPADAFWCQRFNGLYANFMGMRIDFDFIDHPRSGRHAHAGDPTFQGRTRGTGTGHQPIFIAQDHLGIGADIHQDGSPVVLINFRKQNAGNQVAAEITGNVWKNKYSGPGMDSKAKGLGFEGPRGVDHRDIGFTDDPAGIQPHKQMAHGGIAGHRQHV